MHIISVPSKYDLQVHSEARKGSKQQQTKMVPFEGFIATGQLFTPLIFWTLALPACNERSSRIIQKTQWSKHKEFGMFGIGELCINFQFIYFGDSPPTELYMRELTPEVFD